MYEKILQKLKLQRGATSNVSDRSLEDLARAMETVITTDELLNAADLSNAIKSIDGNINHYAAEAVKTAAERKKADEEAARKTAEKKKADEAEAERRRVAGLPPVNSDEPPAWAKELMEQNKQLVEKVNGFEKTRTQSSRLEQLKATLKDMPEFYTKPLLTGFERLSFPDDASFEQYVAEVKTNNESFLQAAKENGLNTIIPSRDVHQPEPTGQTDVLQEAMKVASKAKEDQNKK